MLWNTIYLKYISINTIFFIDYFTIKRKSKVTPIWPFRLQDYKENWFASMDFLFFTLSYFYGRLYKSIF